jgi:oligoendopeptidase F
VVVDIYSRYLFEKAVFERRPEAELSADDFCELMVDAQRRTYADGVDVRYLHRYMWAWKPHYYSPNRSFYNFPYTFGMLFGLGLYTLYQAQGDAFLPAYDDLLSSTGEARSAELAARFGIDIRDRTFWESSMGIIEERIERYLAL